MSSPGKYLSSDNIFRKVFDDEKNALRISGSDAGGGLTDSELRAAPVDVNITSAPVQAITISANEDNVAIADSITGTSLSINTDGSLNAKAIDTPRLNTYNEISSVAQNTVTTILSKTITTENIAYAVDVSGNLVATYWIELNGNIIEKKRSYFGGSPNVTFLLGNLSVTTSDVIDIKVEHDRPYLGNFNAKITLG